MADAGFMQMVLEQRDEDRQKLAYALGQERGPQPYSKQATELEQDQMWLQTHPDYTDPPDVTGAFGRAFSAYCSQGLRPEQAAQHAAVDTLAMYPMSKYMRLLAPAELGGKALTPLAASYEKYPYRRFLVESAGAGSEDQIKYAQARAMRAGPPHDVHVPAEPEPGPTPASSAAPGPAGPPAPPTGRPDGPSPGGY